MDANIKPEDLGLTKEDIEKAKDETKSTDIRVKNTPVFKLKDKPGRIYQAIHLRNQFGFVPEVIIVEKVRGYNNAILVRAVMTPDAIKEEDNQKAKVIGQADPTKKGETVQPKEVINPAGK